MRHIKRRAKGARSSGRISRRKSRSPLIFGRNDDAGYAVRNTRYEIRNAYCVTTRRGMDHRERILTALAHQQPDRVPAAIWGSAYGITDTLYFELLKELKLGDPVSPFLRRMGHTVNYYDDRVLDALDTDVRHVWLGLTDLGGPARR